MGKLTLKQLHETHSDLYKAINAEFAKSPCCRNDAILDQWVTDISECDVLIKRMTDDIIESITGQR